MGRVRGYHPRLQGRLIAILVAQLLLVWLPFSCHADLQGWMKPISTRWFGTRNINSNNNDNHQLEPSSSATSTITREPYSVVSVIVVKGSPPSNDNGASAVPVPALDIQAGCMIVPGHDVTNPPLWVGRALWDNADHGADTTSHSTDNNNKMPLWNTLAFLSDLVLVVVESWDSSSDSSSSSADWTLPDLPAGLIQALLDGLRQRTFSVNLPKGRLILLLNHAASHDELAAWRENLSANHDLSLLSSEVLEQFFIASAFSFLDAVCDIQLDAVGGICKALGDPAGFPELLKQVYLSKGGGTTTTTELVQEEQERWLLPPEFTKRIELSAVDADLANEFLLAFNELASQQEQASWALDPTSPPPDQFGTLTNTILETLEFKLRDSKCSLPARLVIEEMVGRRLQELYQQHLQTLRDYYGTTYETFLDQHLNQPTLWSARAQCVAEAFRQAARNAMPLLARPGQAFCDRANLEYTTAFAGLLQDMVNANEQRQEFDLPTDNGDNDDNDEQISGTNSSASKSQQRIHQWVEKIGARALVLGVNYLQGWLAWQGIRRAALERERRMPKFPLF